MKTAPVELLEQLAAQAPVEKLKQRPTTNGHSHAPGMLDVESFLRTRNIEILKHDTAADGASRWFVPCPGIAAHTTTNGTKDCVITQEADGRLGGQCFHSSCRMRSWTDIRDAIGKPTRDDYPTTLSQNNGRGTDQPHSAPPATDGVPSCFVIRPAGELIDEFPTMRPAIVEGLVRRGECMNIIAPPKTGKSWLSMGLGLSVVSGRQWLGRFWVQPNSWG